MNLLHSLMLLCVVKGDEPEKEAPAAAVMKKQPPVQENPATVQPVRAAAVEVRVTSKREPLGSP